MAIALSGSMLVTTPAGGAAEEVAAGFEATTGRQSERAPRPAENATHVVFYDDGELLQALTHKDPSPIHSNWLVLTNLRDLDDFVHASFAALIEKGVTITTA
jgi:hypothetical protein